MISTAVSIAALAWTPALAALPLNGNIAPILTVLSWADAVPASATEIEAAQSSPTTCLNLMVMVSETLPRKAKLRAEDKQRHNPRNFPHFWPLNIACPVHRGKLRSRARADRGTINRQQ